MIRTLIHKAALMTAVLGILGGLSALGATSAHAMDDVERSPSPVWVDAGVYGYVSGQGWTVYDVYGLPNGRQQRLCHPVSRPSQKTPC